MTARKSYREKSSFVALVLSNWWFLSCLGLTSSIRGKLSLTSVTVSKQTFGSNRQKIFSSSQDADENPSYRFPLGLHTDRVPKRTRIKLDNDGINSTLQPSVTATDWGIHHLDHETLSFPCTLSALLCDIKNAIYRKLEVKQQRDLPSVVRASVGKNGLARPADGKSFDACRIGIELDGLSYLFQQPLSEAHALRSVALQLAGQISSEWKTHAVVYFNTFQQSLMACRELQFLRRVGLESARNISSRDKYNNMTVLTLGTDGFPHTMMPKERVSYLARANGTIDLSRGFVLVVQPTDLNAEDQPPSLSIGSVMALQRLAGQASLAGIPIIVLSPRFLSIQPSSQSSVWGTRGYHRSSIYGGFEPPRGPMPWIMRDFTPPIYSLSSKAMTIPATSYDTKATSSSVYSHMALMQSIIDEGNAWHVFAKRREATLGSDDNFDYLASTCTCTGRPTLQVLDQIFRSSPKRPS